MATEVMIQASPRRAAQTIATTRPMTLRIQPTPCVRLLAISSRTAGRSFENAAEADDTLLFDHQIPDWIEKKA